MTRLGDKSAGVFYEEQSPVKESDQDDDDVSLRRAEPAARHNATT